MRIGLDIDNVIFDTDEEIIKEMILEDKNKRNKGIINKDADYIFLGMFDWSKEEIDEFLYNKMEDIAKRVKPLPKAKYYIDKLLENNEIILISNRSSNQYKDAYTTTLNSLIDNDINYTKLVITETNDKTKECLDNKIDIMIDDRLSNCRKLANSNIKCIMFKTKYEKRDIKDIETVTSWDELYYRLQEISDKF